MFFGASVFFLSYQSYLFVSYVYVFGRLWALDLSVFFFGGFFMGMLKNFGAFFTLSSLQGMATGLIILG